MADDHRYDWLDDDAVERLLRGGSVAGHGSENDMGGDNADKDAADAGIVAERLEAALRSLAVPAPVSGPVSDDVPLPGEEAAVAAFRAARASSAPTPASAASPAAGRTVGAIRSFLNRPMRTVLALTLAGCAVGGVAVAAGAGVLPSPFGRAAKAPNPSKSVVAADGSGTRTLGPDSPYSGATPAPGATEGRRPGESPQPHGSGKPGKGAPSAPGGKETGPGRSSATPGTGTDGGRTSGTGKGEESTGSTGQTWAARLCREFLTNGKRLPGGKGLDEEGLRTLERSAGEGAAAVRTYCERLLGALDGDEQDDSLGGADGDKRDIPRLPRSRSRLHTSTPDPLSATGVTFSGTPAL
ncbi:hypothetical protein [Streptomyces sp. NPDC053048]|uniref:hypothetical protein n=1 Tax=Streptomyces sp. NPDC053048 TaxID=3365694 RepID=UPI0037D26B1F